MCQFERQGHEGYGNVYLRILYDVSSCSQKTQDLIVKGNHDASYQTTDNKCHDHHLGKDPVGFILVPPAHFRCRIRAGTKAEYVSQSKDQTINWHQDLDAGQSILPNETRNKKCVIQGFKQTRRKTCQ